MTTYPSKRQNTQGVPETILILAYLVILSILMVFGFNADVRPDSLSRALGSQSHVYVDSPLKANISFGTDASYWSANCSHGWADSPMCASIALRAQSCAFGSISTYCSSYKHYLFQFNKK